jgi:hypothetical protein
MFDKERVEKMAEAWVNFNRLAIDAIERDPLTAGWMKLMTSSSEILAKVGNSLRLSGGWM